MQNVREAQRKVSLVNVDLSREIAAIRARLRTLHFAAVVRRGGRRDLRVRYYRSSKWGFQLRAAIADVTRLAAKHPNNGH